MMTLKDTRALTELTVEAVDQYLQESVPLLVKKFFAPSLNGSERDLPVWLKELLDERLEQYCGQYVQQQFGDILLTELKLSQEQLLARLSKDIQLSMEKVIQKVGQKQR